MKRKRLCVWALLVYLICSSVQSHAEQIDVVDEWYAICIKDEWIEALMTKCEGSADLAVSLSSEVLNEVNMLEMILTLQDEEPLVEYLWLPGIDKVFFSPTRMYTDGDVLEYYFVRDKMFLIENAKYSKWNMHILSDDAFIWFNEDRIREKMFYFLRTDTK